jgi:hypothetical protein
MAAAIVWPLALTTTWISAAVAARHHAPTLGTKNYPPPGDGPRRVGFGTLAPKVIDAEGDPNSVIHGIHWTHWGSAVATGFGLTAEFASHGGCLPGYYRVELHAQDLGRCYPGGPLVYRRLARRDTRAPGSGWYHWALWPDVQYPQRQLLC